MHLTRLQHLVSFRRTISRCGARKPIRILGPTWPGWKQPAIPLRLGWCPTPGGINRVSVIYKDSRIIFGKLVVTSPHTTTSPDMILIIYSNLRCRHRLWLGTIPKMIFLQIRELLYLSRTMSWKYLGTIVFCLSHVGMAL